MDENKNVRMRILFISITDPEIRNGNNLREIQMLKLFDQFNIKIDYFSLYGNSKKTRKYFNEYKIQANILEDSIELICYRILFKFNYYINLIFVNLFSLKRNSFFLIFFLGKKF